MLSVEGDGKLVKCYLRKLKVAVTAAVLKAGLVENGAWWVSKQRMHVMCVILANPGERMSALFL